MVNGVGIYLILSSLPDQDEVHSPPLALFISCLSQSSIAQNHIIMNCCILQEVICSYLEQQLAGRDIRVHVVYYDMEHIGHNLVVPGREGGRYGNSKDVGECLENIAMTIRGRFHRFKVSGTSASSA